ncbi:MAG TPA: lactate utilization protein [Pyrinomonadaceae bacterium]|nr:lactate utilization protein [Pyrinomonadaceae bacterium]
MIDTAAARAEILSSIRRNLAASQPFDAVYHEHHPPVAQPAAIVQRENSSSNLLAQFKENLEAVAGKYGVVSGEQDAANAVQDIVNELKPRTIAVSDSARVDALLNRINTNGRVLKNPSKSELFDCGVGVTEAQYAIAETGTLVLESDRERSRLTSLLPPVHICILDAKHICGTMSEILQIVQNDLSRTVTFITGPSRTSDIELTLAIGVHGPRELHVIVISDETNA